MTTKDIVVILALWFFITSIVVLAQTNDEVPLLSGEHFRITVAQQDGFVDVDSMGTSFSGYCISMLDRLAERANFTYDLLPPSGKGTLCEHNNTERQAYDPYYRQQYLCGQSDVNDMPVSEYTTDMYLSLYYITPERLRLNQFSVPFHPPTTGSLTMYGTTTHINTFNDLLQLQKTGKHGPVCIQQNTAQESYMTNSFPELDMVRIPGGDKEFYQALEKGICDMMIAEYPVATRFVYLQHQKGQCHIRGKVRIKVCFSSV
jgi:ABC-type amino acid transport substrate-binding protein